MSRFSRVLCGLWAAWLVACQNVAPLTPTSPAPQATVAPQSPTAPATLTAPLPTPTPMQSLWVSDPITIPSDIPLPPNATNLRGINDPNADTADFRWPNPEGRTAVIFTLPDSMETGRAFYQQALPTLGWTFVQTNTFQGGWSMTYRKDGKNELTGYRGAQVTFETRSTGEVWGLQWWTFPAIPWRTDMPVPIDAVGYQYEPDNNALYFYYLPEADVPAQLNNIFNALWDGWLAQGWEFQHGPNYRAEGIEWRDTYDHLLRPGLEDLPFDCAGSATVALPWRDTPEGRVPCEISGYFKMDRPSPTGWTNATSTIRYTSNSVFFSSLETVWVVEVRISFTTR